MYKKLLLINFLILLNLILFCDCQTKFCLKKLQNLKDKCEIEIIQRETVTYWSYCQNVIFDNKDKFKEISILTLQNGVVGKKLLKSFCQHQQGILFWIPWEMYRAHLFRNQIINNFKLLGNHRDFLKDKDLCGADPATGECRTLYEEIIEKSKLDILIEILPIQYEIQNIQFAKWHNVTDFYTTFLGSTILSNAANKYKIIYDKIEYRAEDLYEIKLDDLNLVKDVSIKLTSGNKTIQLNRKGHGSIINYSSKLFERTLPPETILNVTLNGKWKKIVTDFDGVLIKIFDENNIRTESIKSKMIKTTVQDLITFDGEIKEFSVPGNKEPESHNQKSVYPGFKPYAIVATVIVVTLILIVVVHVCLTLAREKRVEKDVKGQNNT